MVNDYRKLERVIKFAESHPDICGVLDEGEFDGVGVATLQIRWK
jgi:hypothetical protein